MSRSRAGNDPILTQGEATCSTLKTIHALAAEMARRSGDQEYVLTLRRMNAVRREAMAAAMVARYHRPSRFRLAARAYLEFVAEVSDGKCVGASEPSDFIR